MCVINGRYSYTVIHNIVIYSGGVRLATCVVCATNSGAGCLHFPQDRLVTCGGVGFGGVGMVKVGVKGTR